MTMIRVTSLEGTLGREEREQLGEKLTNGVLEVETGKDTPEARAGVMVQFEELPNGHWFHGGRAADELYQRNGIFWVTATVMEGPWTPDLRSELVSHLIGALREVAGTPERQVIWATIREVPDGCWSVNGEVVGIEQFLWAFESDRQATIREVLSGKKETSA